MRIFRKTVVLADFMLVDVEVAPADIISTKRWPVVTSLRASLQAMARDPKDFVLLAHYHIDFKENCPVVTDVWLRGCHPEHFIAAYLCHRLSVAN